MRAGGEPIVRAQAASTRRSCAARSRSPSSTGSTLDIPEGSFEALMGRPGSGKSTLLNLIAGPRPPDAAARSIVAGNDLGAMSDGELAKLRARHIGFIFQSYNLMPVLTALENVELPLLLTKLSSAERKQARADRAARRRPRGPHGPLPAPALGRSGAARRDRARHRQRSDDHRRRRADRRPRSQERRRDPRRCSTKLNTEFKKTILMVTHDPAAAERATITRQLDKGRFE